MGQYFSDVVEKAIADIYYCYDVRRAEDAFEALKEAADAGDGDACYLLSRCYSGPEYSWRYHPFKEDEEKMTYYIQRSIQLGSAMGVLGAMRCGKLTPEMEQAMPFACLRDAWDAVFEKAKNGCLFCRNMIGNGFYWLDVLRIDGKKEPEFSGKEAYLDYLRQTVMKCVSWFDSAFRGGMGFAGRNLYNLFQKGENGLIFPQPLKAEEVARTGAELGYPEWQEIYGELLMKKKGQEKTGLSYCERAVGAGQLTAWYDIGDAYQNGSFMPKDIPHALECYEKGLADERNVGCYNAAADIYYLGEGGVTKDYARAIELYEAARAHGSTYGNGRLGMCYLKGSGCIQDPLKALQVFEEVKSPTNIVNYGLGLIYAGGMGVPQDITKGVEYFKKAPNYEPAQKELRRYKKKGSGWVRKSEKAYDRGERFHRIKELLKSPGIAVCLILGIALFILSAAGTAKGLLPKASFEDLLEGRRVKAGSYISGDVSYVLACFASQSTYTEYSDGSRSGSSISGYYYLLPTEDGYIALLGNTQQTRDLNKLMDETEQYLTVGTQPETKVHINGKVEKMDSELLGYYREYMLEGGFTKQELDSLGDPLLVTNCFYPTYYIMTVLGIFLIAIAAFRINKKAKKMKKAAAE